MKNVRQEEMRQEGLEYLKMPDKKKSIRWKKLTYSYPSIALNCIEPPTAWFSTFLI